MWSVTAPGQTESFFTHTCKHPRQLGSDMALNGLEDTILIGFSVTVTYFVWPRTHTLSQLMGQTHHIWAMLCALIFLCNSISYNWTWRETRNVTHRLHAYPVGSEWFLHSQVVLGQWSMKQGRQMLVCKAQLPTQCLHSLEDRLGSADSPVTFWNSTTRCLSVHVFTVHLLYWENISWAGLY